MYDNTRELLEEALTNKKALWEIVLENEMNLSQKSEEEIFARLEKSYEVMLESSSKAMKEPLDTVGGLISGVTKKHTDYAKSGNTLAGELINMAMARALSGSEVNASMGRICAAPTAGSCGIMPSVVISVAEKYDLPRRVALQGMLTASGIGTVVVKNATVAGAEGGCQAECGVSAAIAAAAAVEMIGGTPEQSMHAASITLINSMGLVCDPIAGLVQMPCAQRNASQTVNALISVDMAMAGMTIPVPLDEVIAAMYKVGKMMPFELKETALGGLAGTPTAKAIERKIFGDASKNVG